MRFVSLFAGVGGFDLGFERAGMDSGGQVEIDTRCREILHEHWPHVPKWSDIKEVDGGQFRTDIDVLVGGFPCQDYSVAGRRGGLAGDRGALWWQFHRLADECRPEWIVGENVPGLLSSNDGRDFGTIVGSLVELGYGVVWRVLDAQYFGVAQRRRRVFIVGHSGGEPRPEVLAFAEGVSGDSAPRREAGKVVAPTLGSRTKGGGGLGTDTELDGGLIAGTLETRATWERQRYEENHLLYEPQVANSLRQTDHKAPKVDVAEPSLVAFNWQASGDWVTPHEHYTDALHAGQTPAVLAFSSKDDGADAGELAPTLRSMNYDQSHVNGGGQVAIAGPSVRRLTPLECERLQGFPDNWTASQSDTQRYRQMGNAVAVPVAEWVGRQLAKAE